MTRLSQSLPEILQKFQKHPSQLNRKFLMDCKALYLQYLPVRKWQPDQISPQMGSEIDQLLHALSKYEATEILNSNVLRGMPSGFQLHESFSRKAVYSGLPEHTALEILRELEQNSGNPNPANRAMTEIPETEARPESSEQEARPESSEQESTASARTEPSDSAAAAQPLPTDIPESRLVPASADAELAKLARELIRAERNSACVTAFVDESLRPVLWNRYGYNGPVGAYSYILCRGNLRSEREIRKERILSSGVDFCEETEHVEKITETAIGKVLISLLYNHDFTGSVHIYTDNRNAAHNWQQNPAAARLASQFSSVTVQYISRDHNTIADRLCRSRILLNMPAEAYQEIHQKITQYDEIIKILSPESNPS